MAFLNKQRPADALIELTTASEKFKAQEQTIMLHRAPQLWRYAELPKASTPRPGAGRREDGCGTVKTTEIAE